jgi:hypothetical protein
VRSARWGVPIAWRAPVPPRRGPTVLLGIGPFQPMLHRCVSKGAGRLRLPTYLVDTLQEQPDLIGRWPVAITHAPFDQQSVGRASSAMNSPGATPMAPEHSLHRSAGRIGANADGASEEWQRTHANGWVARSQSIPTEERITASRAIRRERRSRPLRTMSPQAWRQRRRQRRTVCPTEVQTRRVALASYAAHAEEEVWSV